MYKYYDIEHFEINALDAADQPLTGTGVSVYVCTNPDDVSPDFIIDPLDLEGIKIFREFAAKMAAHYQTLKK